MLNLMANSIPSDISSILSELSKLIDNEIISEKEVEAKLFRAVLRSIIAESNFDNFNFDFSVFPDFLTLFEEVKESLFEIPHSITSPHFSEKFEIEGVIFCHLHTCKPDSKKIERAYTSYIKANEFLQILPKMKEITDKFFKGYLAKDGVIREYRGDKHTAWVFYSTMDDVFEDLDYHLRIAERLNGRYCIVVPVEKTPKNFINFFREHSEEAKKAGLRIWVVNPERGTIDPFIGYPKDLNLIKNFHNPRIASIISSFWRAEVKELD